MLANKKKKKVLIASTSETTAERAGSVPRRTAIWCLGPTSKGRWSYACSKAIDEFLAALLREKNAKLPDGDRPPVRCRIRTTPDRAVWHWSSPPSSSKGR